MHSHAHICAHIYAHTSIFKRTRTSDAQVKKLFHFMVNNDPADIQESMAGIRIFNDTSVDWPIAGKNPLFIRKCHDGIFQKMYDRMKQDKPGIILIGNPGLGKSFSIPYHLWRFVREDKTVVVYSSKKQRAWVFNTKLNYYTQVDHVRSLQRKIPELSDKNTVFLWDPHEADYSEPPTMNVSEFHDQIFTYSPLTHHLFMHC